MTWSIFIRILIAIESGGDPTVIGDRDLKHHAYGVLQIRQPYVDDINNFYKKEVDKIFGRPLTAKDMVNKGVAVWVTKKYLQRWSSVFRRKNGREPSWEEMARMHNGGPFGYKRKSTYPYLKKYLEAKRRILE